MTKYFAGFLIALITLKLGSMLAEHLIHVEPLEKMSYIVTVQEESSKPSPQEEKVKIEPITLYLQKQALKRVKIAGRCSQCHSFDKMTHINLAQIFMLLLGQPQEQNLDTLILRP